MQPLADLTTTELREALDDETETVVLVAVGSVEPHGPHLPLSTDTLISEGAIARAVPLLEQSGRRVLVAPAVPYGVTDFAEGFAGAISIPAAALTSFLRAIVEGYVAAGAAHVCLVNNHLEPEQDKAVRGAIAGVPSGRASVACPLERRFAKLLSAEFKRGECHAGRYETSIVMAIAPSLVREDRARGLPAVNVSLSDGIRNGLATFQAMGLNDAYAGAPAEADPAEGEETLLHLAEMIRTLVVEGLELLHESSG